MPPYQRVRLYEQRARVVPIVLHLGRVSRASIPRIGLAGILLIWGLHMVHLRLDMQRVNPDIRRERVKIVGRGVVIVRRVGGLWGALFRLQGEIKFNVRTVGHLLLNSRSVISMSGLTLGS